MTMKACTQFVPKYKQLCFAPKHRARMKAIGKVNIPQEAFIEVLKTN